ncbi:unnamed protein product [Mytilus coruscus]|uniref:Uncharacterized protein n=1 Tax=Mytilus coruscus TaxID=42192 RepID=A0A6J8E304_MYTCO|nr:unnamed protein product [Mytilus coruscus]
MMTFIFETTIKGYATSEKSRIKALKCNDLFSAIGKRDKIGWSPLHLASILCNFEAVDFLINKDATDCTGYLDGKTPLHFSCIERLSGSSLQYEHCLKKPTCTQYTKSQMLSTVLRHQPTEDNTNDITNCKDLATSIRDVRNKVVNRWLYTNEVIMENDIHFEQDKENNWTPSINNFSVYQVFMKEIPKDMKNWRPSVFALIYVTCMNILFLFFPL